MSACTWAHLHAICIHKPTRKASSFAYVCSHSSFACPLFALYSHVVHLYEYLHTCICIPLVCICISMSLICTTLIYRSLCMIPHLHVCLHLSTGSSACSRQLACSSALPACSSVSAYLHACLRPFVHSHDALHPSTHQHVCSIHSLTCIYLHTICLCPAQSLQAPVASDGWANTQALPPILLPPAHGPGEDWLGPGACRGGMGGQSPQLLWTAVLLTLLPAPSRTLSNHLLVTPLLPGSPL